MSIGRWWVVWAAVGLMACAEDGEVVDDGGVPTDGAVNRSDVMAIPLRDGAGMLTPDSACATQTFSSTRAPATLMILLDRSNSMNDPVASGRTRWDAARGAISRLIMRLPAETRVGLMFFPTDQTAVPSTGDSEANYRAPSVPVGPLTTQRAVLLARLAAVSATGRTPMACALPGAITQLAAVAGGGARHVVLITDGKPTFDCTGRGRCDTTDMACLAEVERLAQAQVITAARTGAARTPSVRTFSLGTPDASDAFLSQIAVAGATPRSTTCAPSGCHYSLSNASFEADLDRALDAVRGATSTCEFEISVDSTVADPGLINVRYTPPGGVERTVARDRMRMNGWDYGPGMRSVVFYGAACEALQADTSAMARVQILYGCPTVAPQ